jgi:uncharacterized protein (DUF4415 family)
VRFGWDARKSDRNLRARGFDFEFATQVFDGPTLERPDTRRDYGERRVVAIGRADGITLTLVYTDRAVKPTSKQSKAGPSRGRASLARLRRVSDATIQRTSPRELRGLPDDFWAAAQVVEPVAKQPISLRVDTDVLDWFKAQGPRYQSRINAVLRSFMTQASTAGRRKAG